MKTIYQISPHEKVGYKHRTFNLRNMLLTKKGKEIFGPMLDYRRGVKYLSIMKRELDGRTTKDFIEVVNENNPLLNKLKNLNENDARAILVEDLIDFTGIIKQCAFGLPNPSDFYELIGALDYRALKSVLFALKIDLEPGGAPIGKEAREIISSIENTAYLFGPKLLLPLMSSLIFVAKVSGISYIQITETNSIRHIAQILLQEIGEMAPCYLQCYHAGQIARFLNLLTSYYWNLLTLLPSDAELLYPDKDLPSEPEELENSSSDESLDMFEEPQTRLDDPSSSNILVEEPEAQGVSSEVPTIYNLNLRELDQLIRHLIAKDRHRAQNESAIQRETNNTVPSAQPAELGTEDLETESFSGTEDLEVNENQGAFSAFEPTLKKLLYFLYFMDKYEDFIIPIVFGVGFIYILVRWGIRLVRVFATKYRPLR